MSTEASAARSATNEEHGGETPPAPVESPTAIEPETGSEREGGTAGASSDGVAGAGDGASVASVEAGSGESSGTGESAVRGPYRIGRDSGITPPRKIKDVKPVYPAIAQSARVQGVVIIEATIGPNGQVQEAKVLRSIPLLDQAALDAVKQWQFTPTLLNGVPVPVIMTVTVNFTLQ